jgi:hypothetical protein
MLTESDDLYDLTIVLLFSGSVHVRANKLNWLIPICFNLPIVVLR